MQTDRILSLAVHALDVVSILDEHGIARYESPSIERVLGYAPDEFIGRNALELVHPEDQERLATLLGKNIASFGNILSVEYRYRHKQGHYVHLDSICTNLLHDPAVRGILINSRDITQRVLSEAALRASEERFADAFNYAPIGMALISLEGRWLKVNRAVEDMLGYSADELAVLDFQRVTHPDDLEADLENVQRLLRGDAAFYHMEKRYFHKKGHIIWIQLAVSLARDVDGRPLEFISQIKDITENKLAHERLVYDALHDSLTGLANRALLRDHIETAFNRYQRHPEQKFALMLVDIDRFKNVNDTLGHLVGDKVLRETADRLRQQVRSVDTVARLGGDEFAILIEDMDLDHCPTRIADRILESISQPMHLDGRPLELTVSIGVIVATPAHSNLEEILRDADIALYRAKEAGRNRIQLFDQAMHRRIHQRMEMETELRHAISGQQLELHLQPAIDLRSGSMTSFEALLRWNHPTFGQVPPGVFIPIAEEAGLIHLLGEWVLRTVCRIQASCPDHDSPPIAINLSPLEFTADRLLGLDQHRETIDQRIMRIVEEEGACSQLIYLEVTESATISPAEQHAVAALERLHQAGFKLLLDDFGTGYSSLSRLQYLPFSQLKLDRAFVAQLSPGNRSFDLMRGIVNLAHTLDMEVLAEGVETAEQLQLVRDAGCDQAQGFYFSHPRPLQEATQLYHSKRRW